MGNNVYCDVGTTCLYIIHVNQFPASGG